MNDRFRYRVWNKENKEMIYNAEIAYDGMNYNTSWQIGKNTNDGWVDCFGYYLDYPKDYEVMQCTGLKDKNGKLIYEGDIVEFYSQSLLDAMSRKGLKKRIGQVVWNDEYLKFDVVVKNNAVPDLCKETDDNNFLIIGNIYENKELLESEG